METKIKQCCSCEKVFKRFKSNRTGIYGLCPYCFSGNWVYGFIDENLRCQVCGKSDKDVRFEGMTETNICDSCLYKEKNK